jgi:hypothetical protein
MNREIHITEHAIERWQERVDPANSWLAAHLAIRKLLNSGRSRATPRHWMRRPIEPGTAYDFSASYPGVCAIVSDDAAVTIITRELVRNSPPRSIRADGPRPRSAPPPVPTYFDDDLAA